MPHRTRRLEGPDSPQRLAKLQGRFRNEGQRLDRAARLRRLAERLALPLLAVTATAFAWSLYLYFTGFAPAEAARHLNAIPNCAAARAMGVDDARRGEPGYWPWLDRDKDGLACEPWPK